MKTFGDVHVTLRTLSPTAFADRAEAAATNGWTLDRSKYDELRSVGGQSWFTFPLTNHPTLPPSLLFLSLKPDGTLAVSNVIPAAVGQLDYDEYNAILKSFCDDVLSKIQPPESIDFSLTGTTIDLSVRLPADVFERLQLFSDWANKSTGSSHPSDRDRWMDFIIAAANCPDALDSHTLERWLVEEGQWGAEEAEELAVEYEFGCQLLRRFLLR